MRWIGQLPDEKQAAMLRDLLTLRGIEATIEQREDGAWTVWIQSEDQVRKASAFFKEFHSDPGSQRYSDEIKAAVVTREKEAYKAVAQAVAEKVADRRKVVSGREMFRAPAILDSPVTVVLIVVSVIVTAISYFGKDESLLLPLRMTQPIQQGGQFFYDDALPEIRAGQVWRLITPIFMHFDFLHILFNMMWLMDLGAVVERKKGSFILLLFVVLSAALSNLAQFARAGPWFGGMSGVVYGLIGYIWMHTKFAPWGGLHLSKTTVTMAMVWFVLCFTGALGDIANTAHAVGLLVGIVWGLVAAKWQRHRRDAGVA